LKNKLKNSNMKTKYINIFAVALLALVTGCTNLDVEIKSQYTEFPDNERAQEAVAANAYYAMRGPIGRYYNTAQTLTSDEAMNKSYAGSDWWDNGGYSYLSLHMWNSDSGFVVLYWNDVAAGITKCNQLIKELGGDDTDVAGPLRAVRAYYHWVLMDSYGDVPIMDHVLQEDEAIDRSPRAEVAKFIESELLAVMDRLSEEVSIMTYGRPTKWMAYALLAKLYINWAVYTCGDVATYNPSMANAKLNDALRMCDIIIASGKFNLSDSFRSKFLPSNGAHIKDFIYAMPFDRETQRGMTYSRFWTHFNGNAGFYGVTLPATGGGGIFAMVPEFVDKFNLEGDDRNATIIGGPQFVRNPSTYEATTTPWLVNGEQVVLTKEVELMADIDPIKLPVEHNLKGYSQGYRSIKFYMDLQTTAAQGRSQSNDVPIFRYADILLTKAEAILRGAAPTNGDTPMSLMNQIRAYVHAPLVTQDPTLPELLDERAREFADENWRRNDLIRFGNFEDDWGYKHVINPAAKTEYFRRIFPIGRTILNNNTNWKQNPGY
jgi:hypothetical protein